MEPRLKNGVWTSIWHAPSSPRVPGACVKKGIVVSKEDGTTFFGKGQSSFWFHSCIALVENSRQPSMIPSENSCNYHSHFIVLEQSWWVRRLYRLKEKMPRAQYILYQHHFETFHQKHRYHDHDLETNLVFCCGY